MKKLYIFLTLAIFLSVPASTIAQELVLNGDLELWDDALNPTSWDNAENINQAASPVHTGSYSAQHMSSEDGTQDLQQNVGGIIGGLTYTISYWYWDSDPAAKTRIWAYWLDGGSTMADHADELRANIYSEDNSEWQQFTIELTAPAGADEFRFEVRVYGQDGSYGGYVYYDDFSVMGPGAVPEPTNYPGDFAAAAEDISINLSWADATGDQLPNGYLIKAATFPKMLPPTDGIPEENDLDLSDGEGSLNVVFGEEMCSFNNLDPNTQYFFVIFPYTNGGVDIDYKTGDIPPQASATTEDINVILSQNFDNGFGTWEVVSVIGLQFWEIDETSGVNETPCAKMNGYSGGSVENEDWLISPIMDFSSSPVVTLTYMTAMNYSGPELEVLVSTDYDGSGAPTLATWESVGGMLSSGNTDWTASGNVDLSNFESTSIYLAFKYTSTTEASASWEVDDIMIIGGDLNAEPSNYPTDLAAAGASASIKLDWVDALGPDLPAGYLVLASANDNIEAPVDGTAIADDPDLSDGTAALNITFGTQTCTFDELGANETYYFAIYPYSNGGSSIDYKTDGTAPAASAATADVVVIHEQDFDDGWGNWIRISVIGDLEWIIDDEHGVDDTPCAKCSGYDVILEQPTENEDWLISPAFNFDNFESEVLTFQTANNYSGPELEVLIATDFDGVDPWGGNWQTLEWTVSPSGWDWTPSGEIDISGYDGETVYIAFVFSSTDTESATWEVDDVKITGVGEIGIDETDAFTAEIGLYPNPASNKVNITSDNNEILTYSVFSLLGSPMIEQITFSGQSMLDISSFADGIYLIRLTDQQGNSKIEKLIIEK